MKNRIISVCLTLAIFVSCFAFPAMAAENSIYTNVLDYSTLNESGSNFIEISPDNDRFYYSLPQSGDIESIELIVTSAAELTTAKTARINITSDDSASWRTLNVVSLGNDIYRIYGDPGTSYEWSNIWFNFYATEYSIIQVLSLKVSFIETKTFACPVYGNVKHGPNHITTSQFSYAGGESYSDKISLGDGTAGTATFEAQFMFDWENFDYITFGLDCRLSTISSLSAYVNGQSVPLEVNTFPYAGMMPQYYFLSVTLDLTGIDESYGIDGNDLDDSLIVTFNGAYQDGDGESDYIYFAYCTGSIDVEGMSLLSYWFMQLEQWLRGHTSTLNTSISAWGEKIVDALAGNADTSEMESNVGILKDQVEDANNALNEFTRPAVEDVITDVDLDIGTDTPFADMMRQMLENDFIVSIITGSLAFTLFGILVG